MKAYRLALLFVLLSPSQMLAQSSRQIPNSQFVVFVHAGPKSTDPRIKQITGALFAKGYQVRAADNEQDTVGGAGVDYFDDSAKATADEIAKLMNEKLAAVQLKTATDKDLEPRFQRVKNPPTYIGVWLFSPTPTPTSGHGQ